MGNSKTDIILRVVLIILVIGLLSFLAYKGYTLKKEEDANEERLAIEEANEEKRVEVYWNETKPVIEENLATYLDIDPREIVINENELDHVDNDEDLAEAWFSFKGFDTLYNVNLNEDLSINKITESQFNKERY